MKRIRHVWKALLVFLAVAMISLVLTGCKKGDEQPPGEHPSKEHSSDEHPSSDHPN